MECLFETEFCMMKIYFVGLEHGTVYCSSRAIVCYFGMKIGYERDTVDLCT